jgi:hypothetical protein
MLPSESLELRSWVSVDLCEEGRILTADPSLSRPEGVFLSTLTHGVWCARRDAKESWGFCTQCIGQEMGIVLRVFKRFHHSKSE